MNKTYFLNPPVQLSGLDTLYSTKKSENTEVLFIFSFCFCFCHALNYTLLFSVYTDNVS